MFLYAVPVLERKVPARMHIQDANADPALPSTKAAIAFSMDCTASHLLGNFLGCVLRWLRLPAHRVNQGLLCDVMVPSRATSRRLMRIVSPLQSCDQISVLLWVPDRKIISGRSVQ
eukprot:662248-Rhodomonas_salina.1